MKKILISSLIMGILTTNYAFANNEQMFENTNSKEWSSTPPNVRSALKNIKVMSGSSAKDMMSTNWLNELKRSPNTYGLNKNDVAWVDGMLYATKNKNVWNPKTKVDVKAQIEPVKPAPVKQKSEPVKETLVAKNKSEPVPTKSEPISSKAESSLKLADKKPVVTTPPKEAPAKKVAISTPLPKAPVDYASNKNPDLTPVKPPVKKEAEKVEPKENASVNEANLLKISEVLTVLHNKEKENNDLKEAEKIKRVLDLVNEMIRIEAINKENVLMNAEQKQYADNIISQYNNTFEAEVFENGVEKLLTMIDENNDEILEITNNLSEMVEESKVKVEPVVETITPIEPKKAEKQVQKSTKEAPKTESVDLNNLQNSVNVLNDNINTLKNDVKKPAEIKQPDSKKQDWKLKVISILSGFGLLSLLLLNFRRGKK